MLIEDLSACCRDTRLLHRRAADRVAAVFSCSRTTFVRTKLRFVALVLPLLESDPMRFENRKRRIVCPQQSTPHLDSLKTTDAIQML